MRYKQTILLTLVSFIFLLVKAQKVKHKDVQADIQKILAHTNQYPVQLQMKVVKTNSPADWDTANYTVALNWQEQGLSLNTGNMEQLITDSIMLTLLHNEKQIIVNKAAPDSRRQFQNSMMPLFNKDAMDELKQKFNITQQLNADTATIILLGKNTFFKTELPTQEIKISYNKKTWQPYQIKLLARQVAAATDTAEVNSTRVIVGDDNKKFAVREAVTMFQYISIAHNIVKLPFSIFDKIEKDEELEYKPAKGMEAYNVSIY
jgi:hypothetical protein